MTRIGVIGAGGRLGKEIISILVRQKVSVLAIASSKQHVWGDKVSYHQYESNSSPEKLRPVLLNLDAVINATPTSSSSLQKEAIESGCHVVDVGIETEVVAQLLELDTLAKTKKCSLVAMAGLAPGLTGLIGTELLKRTAQADFVDICLIQNSQGTSGKRGTKDMLNLLTVNSNKRESCLVYRPEDTDVVEMQGFSFATPESILLPEKDRLRFYTAFDSAMLNILVENMGRLRRFMPSMYQLLRDKIAETKANLSISEREEIYLSAVAAKSNGQIEAGSFFRLTGDYRATAAIACTIATIAVFGDCVGAGHIGSFVSLDIIFMHPLFQDVILEFSYFDGDG